MARSSRRPEVESHGAARRCHHSYVKYLKTCTYCCQVSVRKQVVVLCEDDEANRLGVQMDADDRPDLFQGVDDTWQGTHTPQESILPFHNEAVVSPGPCLADAPAKS